MKRFYWFRLVVIPAVFAVILASCNKAPEEVAALPDSAGGVSTSSESADRVPEFKVDPFWPLPLPNNWLIGQVSGVAVDSQGNIYTGEVEHGKRAQKFIYQGNLSTQ